jgi:hypothetical protein
MPKKKLKKDDMVLVLTLNDPIKGKRQQHTGAMDKVKSAAAGKVKLNKHVDDDFDDDGKHVNPKRRLVKLQPAMANKLLKSVLVGVSKIDSITAIKLDDKFLQSIDMENENEI